MLADYHQQIGDHHHRHRHLTIHHLESVNQALHFLITITKDNQNKIQDLLVK
jgi:hypothetical protein